MFIVPVCLFIMIFGMFFIFIILIKNIIFSGQQLKIGDGLRNFQDYKILIFNPKET